MVADLESKCKEQERRLEELQSRLVEFDDRAEVLTHKKKTLEATLTTKKIELQHAQMRCTPRKQSFSMVYSFLILSNSPLILGYAYVWLKDARGFQ